MWIETAKQLPTEGKYVLGRHNRGTWHDNDDQENVNCVVVKLKKGISQKERTMMENGEIESPISYSLYFAIKRHLVETIDDEAGNNHVPYSFHVFGSGHFFGQEITHWQPIECV